MQYLTPSVLHKNAPATQRLPQSDDKLINTGAFLRHVGGMGYKPVYAAQGTPHVDSDTALKSRHLVVAAKDDGQSIAILNSHTVWRRAWLGAGYSWSEPHTDETFFMLGAVLPLPRWRGYEEPLDKLLGFQDPLKRAKNALQGWLGTLHEVRWVARKMASTAYFKGHRKPLVQGVYANLPFPVSMWDTVRIMHARMVRGGLPPEPEGKFLPPRKLKTIISPDALMLASNAAFLAGTAALNKYRDLASFEFSTFRGYQK